MKQVEFHYNVADKLAYTCRLLRKVVGRDLRAVVVGDEATLQALGLALWSLGPTEFMAHCHANAPAGTLAACASSASRFCSTGETGGVNGGV